MFLEREITPDFARELESQKIIIAHSASEVFAQTKNRTKGDLDTSPHIAAEELDFMLEQWKRTDSWTVLKGLRVLDLASGSGYSRDMFGTHYYPHFSRLCAVNGANVVAVDVNPQKGLDEEMFMWVAEDLIDVVLEQGLKNLPVLRGKEFDVIHSSDFVGFNPCPDLSRQLASHGMAIDEFENVFLQQAGELLAEGGIMYLGSHSEDYLPIFHTKRGAEIVTL